MAKTVVVHGVPIYDHKNGKVTLNDVTISTASTVMTVTTTPTGDLGNTILPDGTLNSTPVDQTANV